MDPETDRRYKVDGRRAVGWSNYQLALIVGVARPTMSRWRNAVLYPDIRSLKKIEKIFGWPASEQIDLIPLSGFDMRWSLVFNQVVNEWLEANPREVSVNDLGTEARTRRTDPSRPVGRPRKKPPLPPLNNM